MVSRGMRHSTSCGSATSRPRYGARRLSRVASSVLVELERHSSHSTGATRATAQWATPRAGYRRRVPRPCRCRRCKVQRHLAELDELGWRAFAEDAREAHRADVHQILAYASLFDAPEVRAILIYPLRERTWRALSDRGRDISVAELLSGRRRVRLELRGLPFGAAV